MPQVSAVVDPCASFGGVGYTASETSTGSGICEISFAYSGTDPQTSYTWSVPTGVSAADVIVVGGGGGGGGGKAVPNVASPDNSELFSGNGGGGGNVTVGSVTISTATVVVKVGKGGAGGAATAAGSAGGASEFAALLASGGGGGGAVDSSNPGSTTGGGSGRSVSGAPTSSANGGTGLGTLFSASGKQSPGGGGAGAGQSPSGTNAFPLNAGGDSYVAPWLNGGTRSVNATLVTTPAPGNYPGAGFGGNGYQPVIGLFSTNLTYYGGGGAGGNTNDSFVAGAGYGGGAAGGRYFDGAAQAFNGTASTGGGGGGGYAGRIFDGVAITYPVGVGGAGGSGVVIVRWALSSPSPTPTSTTPATAPATTPAQDPSPSTSATPTASGTPTLAPTAPARLDPIGQAQNPNIPAGGLPAGGSVLLVNGQPVPLVVSPNSSSDPVALVFKAPGLNMRLEGRGDANDPLGLTSKQALVLQSEGTGTTSGSTMPSPRSYWVAKTKVQPTARTSGDGFAAASPVKLYILPSTYLGEVITDAKGAFAGAVPMPPGIAPGVYTLQANGFAPDFTVRSLNIGVLVKPTAQTVATAKSQTKVLFAPLSAELTDAGKAKLRKLVKRTGKDAVRTVSIGYVQPTSSTDNDRALSTLRAKNVAAYLRSIGMKGAYVVKGNGVAKQSGAIARRVEVTVTYRA